MPNSLSFIVVIVVFIGLVFKYFIFREESENQEVKHFLKSRILLEFAVDIIIIFLGHFISMGITQWDNDIKEKEKAIEMLEQACEFAQEQYNEHLPYFEQFETSDLSIYQLEMYAALDLEYFDKVVSNESVIKHLDTHTYGIFCKYLKYLEVIESQINSISYDDPGTKYSMMKVRRAFLGRLIKVLDVCSIEATGELTAEEYDKLMEILNEENIQSYPMHDHASEYLIDRTSF